MFPFGWNLFQRPAHYKIEHYAAEYGNKKGYLGRSYEAHPQALVFFYHWMAAVMNICPKEQHQP